LEKELNIGCAFGVFIENKCDFFIDLPVVDPFFQQDIGDETKLLPIFKPGSIIFIKRNWLLSAKGRFLMGNKMQELSSAGPEIVRTTIN
jgi:hypothetical protein